MSSVLPFPSNPHRRDEAGEPSGDTGDAPGPRVRDVIGEVLRAERLDQQRSLADVAEAAAVSLPYLSEVERGRKDVSSDVLHAICDALELPVADLLERSADRFRVGARPQGSVRLELLAA